jgi:antitoxin component of RelBE/YafQ-DinJ toxin-antitoxin module
VGKSVKKPKKHIVSCRVDEAEMEALQHLTEESGISISDLLRQSLLQLCDQPQQSTQHAV